MSTKPIPRLLQSCEMGKAPGTWLSPLIGLRQPGTSILPDLSCRLWEGPIPMNCQGALSLLAKAGVAQGLFILHRKLMKRKKSGVFFGLSWSMLKPKQLMFLLQSGWASVGLTWGRARLSCHVRPSSSLWVTQNLKLFRVYGARIRPGCFFESLRNWIGEMFPITSLCPHSPSYDSEMLTRVARGDQLRPLSVERLQTRSVRSKSSHPGLRASLKAIRVPSCVLRRVGILKQAQPSVWEMNGILERQLVLVHMLKDIFPVSLLHFQMVSALFQLKSSTLSHSDYLRFIQVVWDEFRPSHFHVILLMFPSYFVHEMEEWGVVWLRAGWRWGWIVRELKPVPHQHHCHTVRLRTMFAGAVS